MQELSFREIESVGGAHQTEFEFGVSVGEAIGYVIGGGAGRDLGIWLHKKFN